MISAAYLADVSGPTVTTSRVMTSLACTGSPRDVGRSTLGVVFRLLPGSPGAGRRDLGPCGSRRGRRLGGARMSRRSLRTEALGPLTGRLRGATVEASARPTG